MPLERGDAQTVGGLNDAAVQRLRAVVLAPEEVRLPVLLTAPRAGFGKTHVLARLAAAVADRMTVLPLKLPRAESLVWSRVAGDTLEHWRAGSAPGEWLREACTGMGASLLKRLIMNGQLPCANREQAVHLLTVHGAGLFQQGNVAKPLGDWWQQHYDQLSGPLAALVHELTGARGAEHWLAALFACAQAGSAESVDAVLQRASASKESFLSWLRLLALWRPLLLLADHLDHLGFQSDAARGVVALLLELAELDQVRVVLSANQDLWRVTLAPVMPSAVADRLQGAEVELKGLGVSEASALLHHRLQRAGAAIERAAAFERWVNLPEWLEHQPVNSVSVRALLRHLAERWDAWSEGASPSLPVLAWTPLAADSGKPAAKAMALRPDQTDVDSTLHQRFEILWRQEMAVARQGALDRSEIEELVCLVGRLCPLVRLERVPLPGLPEQSVPRWTLLGQAVWFGLSDPGEVGYWQALARLVAESAVPTSVKVLGFQAGQAPSADSAFGSLWELQHCLEVLRVDARRMAAVRALRQLLAEAVRGEIASAASPLMRLVAREVDFLWQSATRLATR